METDYEGMIDDLMQDDSDTLSAWEVEFIEAMSDRLCERQNELSSKMEAKIVSIWEKVFG